MALGFAIIVLRNGSLYQRNSCKRFSSAGLRISCYKVLRNVIVDIKLDCFSFFNDYVVWVLTHFCKPFVLAVASLFLGWKIIRRKTLTVTEYHA